MNTLSFLRFPRLVLLLALPLALAACGGGADAPGEDAPAAPAHDAGLADGTSSVRRVDGVQVVEIEAGASGYHPRAITLDAGVPARLVFTRTVESGCSSQVTIPAYDVPVTDLPMHEAVAIEFTPVEGGSFEFICGMEMQRGSIMVRS